MWQGQPLHIIRDINFKKQESEFETWKVQRILCQVYSIKEEIAVVLPDTTNPRLLDRPFLRDFHFELDQVNEIELRKDYTYITD